MSVIVISNSFLVGWFGAGSFYAMADKKYWWSAVNLALAFGFAMWG